MKIDSVVTPDGRGYQLSIRGNHYSRQFKRELNNVSTALNMRFHRVLHKSQLKEGVEHHIYRVYGDTQSEQLGGGLYFTYNYGMSDMSCYVVAHLRKSQKVDNLWKFVNEEREVARNYCTAPITPHITLYECHMNCDAIHCPADKFVLYQTPSWISDLATKLLPSIFKFLVNSTFIVAETGRYSIFGKQIDNQFIAMILQLLTRKSMSSDGYVQQFREDLLGIIIRGLGGDLSHNCMVTKRDPDFDVLCDYYGTEMLAIPRYHTEKFVPHISLGTINRPFNPQTDMTAFDYANTPDVTTIPDDIRFIEVSFKNKRHNFFYHCVRDLSTRAVYHLDDMEYQAFAAQNLDMIH